jgi:pimeloyl-ACP methyl ester carboxylesterase
MPHHPNGSPEACPELVLQRAEVRDGLALGYWRLGPEPAEGSGYPLLLIHGFPETKRIWLRNLAPLAAAGFDVIAPDLRGVGDSDPAGDDFYDPPAYGRDLHALLHDVLGLAECGVVAGDVGGAVAMDLSLRFPGFVSRQCIFNTLPPVLPEAWAAAGIPDDPPRETLAPYDYFIRQGTDAEGLVAELCTPALRRAYVRGFYTHRLLASETGFTPAEADSMAEPFGDAAQLRAAMAVYELEFGRRRISELPRLMETSPVPTLVLYGPEDRVVRPSFMRRMAVAFPDHAGPFVVHGSGHFVQWEAPDVLHSTLVEFFRDLLTSSA